MYNLQAEAPILWNGLANFCQRSDRIGRQMVDFVEIGEFSIIR